MSARTSIRTGLVGVGIGASRSPALHMREGEAHGLDYRYDLFDLSGDDSDAALARTMAQAQAQGRAGLNVTFPFKQRVIALLDDLSADARALGAVNTVVFENGRRIGHNTDWSGFAEGFGRGLPQARLGKVVLLGSGGAGVAVAHALLTMGTVDLALVEPDPVRLDAALAGLRSRFGERVRACGDLRLELADADGLVNATPVGMEKHPGLPLPKELLRPGLFVAEIVYFPLETALLAEARRIGAPTVDGGGMAVFQAVGAFRLFTGREPDPARMLAHFAAMASDAEGDVTRVA